MNTVKLGDEFEEKSYHIIEQALNNDDLGLIPKYCKIYRKKGYYSFRRKKEIIFDLSIEVTPPNAKNPTLLYLIECKNYSNSIPVDDIAVFGEYMNQINDVTKKGIFICNNRLQSSAVETLKSYGMMLIEVNDNDYSIIFHRTDKLKNQDEKDIELDEKIRKTIENALLPKKIDGLKQLSAKQIQNIANTFLNDFDNTILTGAHKLDLQRLTIFLENKYQLKIEYVNLLNNDNTSLLGYFDSENNKILIDYSIIGTERFPFTLAHEIGHFVLHRNLKMNQIIYNNFKDSVHNIFSQQYELKNDRNWIEWQANCFASSILMPHTSILARLIEVQRKMGVSRNQGSIYIDHQEQNRKDFHIYIDHLSDHFGTSKQSVEYRLKSLGIIITPKDVKHNYANEQERIRQESIRRANEFMNKNFYD
ncbi:ImmA/IrrE family metallo-endopeptidase [Chryseobacterium sp. JUb7]|uniref:ImmA/IrrE family metallo-endopeptidase n=1 Tax=Chryseobacterium sp. JUb7 TaxID=2940599 RepID=UPI00216A1A35|nr:ImmA/IrrE family metallo-endopeptidase [Chryseobacterium sp. JUb7]MCS3528652.1 Zn-dependent peptidase ImmA (M78 family) [Chryseobacterium sp. JUb7]